MDAPIVTCAQCGQRNRLRATTSKKGIWTCRSCGAALSATESVTDRLRRYRTPLIVAAALLLPIAAYASVWTMEALRSRAFAAAAADEFNQGNFDRAAVLALSGLPKPGSLFNLFQPGDAEAQLRRTGIHQIKDERLIPKAKDAGISVVKDRFLVRLTDDTTLVITDMTDGQEHTRSIAAACASVQGVGDGCAVNNIDTDDEGRRLLLAHDDGSVWLVEADDSARMLVPPKCKAGVTDHPAACAASRVHLSPSGRRAVFSSKPQSFTARNLDTGMERTLDFTRDCDAEKTSAVKALCQEYPARVLTFRGDDVLLARHGSRATLWLLSENGIARDLPIPLDRAVSGPDNALTGFTIAGDSVAQIISARGQPLAQGPTVKIGNCATPAPAPGTPERAAGCRISSIAVSPKSPDLAIAITGGDIIVQRLVAGDDVPAQRTLKVDCLPLKADAFALFDMERPSRCSMTALRFAPKGSALAALGNDRVLRVYRLSDGPERRGDGALLASVALDASVTYFGFDADDATLIVALDSGAIRRFDLVAPDSEALPAGRPEPRSRAPGALRGAICASLGDRQTPLNRLSDADLDELRTRYPGLKLSRSPCAKL